MLHSTFNPLHSARLSSQRQPPPAPRSCKSAGGTSPQILSRTRLVNAAMIYPLYNHYHHCSFWYTWFHPPAVDRGTGGMFSGLGKVGNPEFQTIPFSSSTVNHLNGLCQQTNYKMFSSPLRSSHAYFFFTHLQRLSHFPVPTQDFSRVRIRSAA